MLYEEMAPEENHRQEFLVKCSQIEFKNAVRTPPSIWFHSWGTKEFNIHKPINVMQPIPRLELRDHTISWEAAKAFEEVEHPSMINNLDYLELEKTCHRDKKAYMTKLLYYTGKTHLLSSKANNETIGSHS